MRLKPATLPSDLLKKPARSRFPNDLGQSEVTSPFHGSLISSGRAPRAFTSSAALYCWSTIVCQDLLLNRITTLICDIGTRFAPRSAGFDSFIALSNVYNICFFPFRIRSLEISITLQSNSAILVRTQGARSHLASPTFPANPQLQVRQVAALGFLSFIQRYYDAVSFRQMA